MPSYIVNKFKRYYLRRILTLHWVWVRLGWRVVVSIYCRRLRRIVRCAMVHLGGKVKGKKLYAYDLEFNINLSIKRLKLNCFLPYWQYFNRNWEKFRLLEKEIFLMNKMVKNISFKGKKSMDKTNINQKRGTTNKYWMFSI